MSIEQLILYVQYFPKITQLTIEQRRGDADQHGRTALPSNFLGRATRFRLLRRYQGGALHFR